MGYKAPALPTNHHHHHLPRNRKMKKFACSRGRIRWWKRKSDAWRGKKTTTIIIRKGRFHFETMMVLVPLHAKFVLLLRVRGNRIIILMNGRMRWLRFALVPDTHTEITPH